MTISSNKKKKELSLDFEVSSPSQAAKRENLIYLQITGREQQANGMELMRGCLTFIHSLLLLLLLSIEGRRCCLFLLLRGRK